MTTESLIARLEAIAKKNEDEFRYSIDIQVLRSKRDAGKVSYTFQCEEVADGHPFVSGTAQTVEEAVLDAYEEIPEALTAWGYMDSDPA